MNLPAWLFRIMAGIGLYLIDKVFETLFGAPENTRTGATFYYAIATLANACTIVMAAHVLRGRVSLDIQRLGLCAIVVNFLAWLGYLAEQSPVVTNTTITVIFYVQYARLFWGRDGDGDDDRRRVCLVRWLYILGNGLHTQEGKR